MTKTQRFPPRMAGDFVRWSERDKSEGGRASPVAVDVAGVREGEQGRESSGRERE
jgi:hypothetical protein